MGAQFQFSTQRLLLATAVLAVWIAVLVSARERFTGDEAIAEGVGSLLFVMSTLLLCAGAAVIVKTLGKRSNVAALLGAAAYVARS